MSTLFKDVLALDGFMDKAVECDLFVEKGLIKYMRPTGRTLDFKPDEVVEGNGKLAVLPGFVNGHTHAAMTLLRGLGEEKPLMEWLKERIWPVEARLKPEHIYWGTRLAILEMISRGITCFGDMYFEMDQVGKAVLETGIRAGLCIGIVGDDRKKIDNSASFFENWNGRGDLIKVQFGPHAPYTISMDMVKDITSKAAELKAGVHFHFLETEWELEYLSEEFGMSPMEYLDASGLSSSEYLILAHCVWFPVEQMPLCRGRKISFCHNVKSNLKLGSGIFPIEGVLENSINISLGTDGAASNNQLDIWDEMKTAALIHKGVRKDPTVAGASDILRMATFGGASSLGFENTGRLKEGWEADLAIVDLDRPHYVGADADNLCCFIVYAGSSADVTGTMVKGKWLYKKKVGFCSDADRIVYEASRCRSEITGGK